MISVLTLTRLRVNILVSHSCCPLALCIDLIKVSQSDQNFILLLLLPCLPL